MGMWQRHHSGCQGCIFDDDCCAFHRTRLVLKEKNNVDGSNIELIVYELAEVEDEIYERKLSQKIINGTDDEWIRLHEFDRYGPRTDHFIPIREIVQIIEEDKETVYCTRSAWHEGSFYYKER